MAKSKARPGGLTEMVLTDVEQLKAISDPLRLRLLEVMGEPADGGWTAKELASRLKTRQTKLYHHLSMLEERGFIRVAQTRMVSGILEKRYELTADSFRVDRSLLAGGGEPAVAETLDVIFDKSRTEIMAAIRAGLIDLESSDPDRLPMGLSMSHARLSRASARKVMRQIKRLAAIDETDEPDGIDYALLVGFYPRPPRKESDR